MARCPSVMTLTGTMLLGIFMVYVFMAWGRRRQVAGYMDLGALMGAASYPHGGSQPLASGLTAPQAGEATAQQLLQPTVTGNVANESLRKVLIYVENNPTDLSKFLNFLKSNFFTPEAQFADPTPTSGLVGRYRNVFKETIITEASASSNI